MYQQGTEKTAEQHLTAARAALKALSSFPQKEEAEAGAARSWAAAAVPAQPGMALTIQHKPHEEPANNAKHQLNEHGCQTHSRKASREIGGFDMKKYT